MALMPDVMPPALDCTDAVAAPTPGWSYTLSVRALCELTGKRGDLDRRFTPSATALEGIKGQPTVANRRGKDNKTEIRRALTGRGNRRRASRCRCRSRSETPLA